MKPFSPAWFRHERARAEERWYLWPGVVTFFAFGMGGMAWSAYNGWWDGVAFSIVWLVLLVGLFGPSRRGWQRRRAHREAT